ncbi:hypothetical protein [Leptolyngbya ohadii]|uniref:hypothetical protein n=1 Tax=Leptolyngbya ohadii TaxID=1962290 RepID=UPI000B59C296|nr:hypothetical protein [Leptolyngbya ohadii]
MFSLNDRSRLEEHGFDRLKSLFSDLRPCTLFLDPERTLHIVCSHQSELEAIEQKRGAIERRAYLSLGCCQVLAWVADTDLELVASVEDDTMPTATLEKPATSSKSTTAQSTPSNRLPGQTLNNIAADVEQTIDIVREWFVGKGITPIPFGDDEIVSGEDAIGCYSHFEPMVIQARMARRGLSLPKTEQNGNGATATATKPAATKSTAKAPAKTAAAKKKTSARKPATRTKKSGDS